MDGVALPNSNIHMGITPKAKGDEEITKVDKDHAHDVPPPDAVVQSSHQASMPRPPQQQHPARRKQRLAMPILRRIGLTRTALLPCTMAMVGSPGFAGMGN